MQPKILVIRGWGYSMLMNNFYEVLRETKGRAIVKDIGSRTVDGDGFQGHEAPSRNVQNVNFKEYTIIKRMKPDGSIEYRGKCGLSSTYTLEEVKEGDKFAFDHLD
jgi:hypothetical protein